LSTKRPSTSLIEFWTVSMQGLKTISFLEGENGMTCYVAYQQDTGTGPAYPFLHRVPAGAISFSGGQISAEVGQNQPKSSNLRSIWVKFRCFAGHSASREVRTAWGGDAHRRQQRSTGVSNFSPMAGPGEAQNFPRRVRETVRRRREKRSPRPKQVGGEVD